MTAFLWFNMLLSFLMREMQSFSHPEMTCWLQKLLFDFRGLQRYLRRSKVPHGLCLDHGPRLAPTRELKMPISMSNSVAVFSARCIISTTRH